MKSIPLLLSVLVLAPTSAIAQDSEGIRGERIGVPVEAWQGVDDTPVYCSFPVTTDTPGGVIRSDDFVPYQQMRTATIVEDVVDVRYGPGAGYAIKDTLEKGQRVIIEGYGADGSECSLSYRITAPVWQGWIPSNLVR